MEKSTHCYFFLYINRKPYKKLFSHPYKTSFLIKVYSILVRHYLINVLYNFSLGMVQTFILIANCPVDEQSCRRTVLSANCPVTEISCRRTVLSPKFPVGELSCRRTFLSVHFPVGELFGWRTVCRRSVRVPSETHHQNLSVNLVHKPHNLRARRASVTRNKHIFFKALQLSFKDDSEMPLFLNRLKSLDL